ncbi:endonuclease/exonuclease/phosphatase family protein [Companilactobacillus furfuricola]|uniref:endonuclease/exonuclease/phosphatase family protein n=1 Tax=Companilactobacillus furfuricola TaxID=1462575 RepID=UPI000F7AEA9C|nr:endonuclease/exonuclease/phosphatase family protein [Companilactobacillus furfuricola]
MENLKILEWNINGRSSNKPLPEFVFSEILKREPDVAVLLEFNGTNNARKIKKVLSEYHVFHYDGAPYAPNFDKSGNGILMAIKKGKFDEESISEHHPDQLSDDDPDWFTIECSLLNKKKISITGIHVRPMYKISESDMDKNCESKDIDIVDSQRRKNQIEKIIKQNSNLETQIQVIVGDFNYGPHVTKFLSSCKWNSDNKDYFEKEPKGHELNWQNIIDMLRINGFCKNPDFSPYSPLGTSWKGYNLDWLVIRKIRGVNTQIDKSSDYNSLDWEFAKNYQKNYTDGYLVPEGYFVRTDPGHPDHAIFTAEIRIS